MKVNILDVPVNADIYDENTGIQATVMGFRPVFHRVTGELVEGQTWVRLWVYGYGNESGARWNVPVSYETELSYYGQNRTVELI